jgi:NAD(P)-dependent dehydrogenase (short-subunit alcohol dehydrogenase family)
VPFDRETADGDGCASIDPADLAVCLAVLAEAEALPDGHPDAVAIRLATAKLYKAVKVGRRAARRAAIANADRAVIAATATGAPGRIDDETAGLRLVSSASDSSAGSLLRARPCYVCKQRYTEVDAFYHQLCPGCAARHHERRNARTDLSGRRAVLTGGRAKIGMHIALRLLRDGAHTTITTRFPGDAARRFSSMPDSAEWLDRLRIVGIDLRDPAQVVALADSVAEQGSLDILINNAAQTVRRSADAYAPLAAAESVVLRRGDAPDVVSFGPTRNSHPALLEQALALSADELTARALVARSADSRLIGSELAIDAGGLVPDVTEHANSWTARVDDVDPVELLEVQLCNVTAPFILIGRLRAAMAAASAPLKYIVNVSAMEGQFARGYKGPGHPHTNMAKAALNMLTRTSAYELRGDGILMTSVDTGWITDERPHVTKMRLAAEGFHAPLDLEDGAARVYDPIVRGEAGEELFGCFLKDYAPTAW